MSESEFSLIFDLPEAVEVELPDKTLELWVSEEDGSDFSLHEIGVKDINVALGGVPGDDMRVDGVLNVKIGTYSIF